ncbi:MAG: ABC transporter permease subunit, partial [Fusobacteriaceae bacterium]|nr:ABC transporter permease subunit [Fusobacteriaceae bacterium]
MVFDWLQNHLTGQLPVILRMVRMSLTDTVYMIVFAGFFATLLGSPIGVLLVVTREGNILANPKLNKVVQAVINVFRSIPFIILMICLMPMTRRLIGTTIGKTAAIVPLSISAAPFVARMLEGALNEVDK